MTQHTIDKINAIAQCMCDEVSKDPCYTTDRKAGETAYDECYRSIGDKRNAMYFMKYNINLSSVAKTKSQRKLLATLLSKKLFK